MLAILVHHSCGHTIRRAGTDWNDKHVQSARKCLDCETRPKRTCEVGSCNCTSNLRRLRVLGRDGYLCREHAHLGSPIRWVPTGSGSLLGN